jgi:protein TonB
MALRASHLQPRSGARRYLPPTLLALLIAVGGHAALLLGVKLARDPVISAEEVTEGRVLVAVDDVSGPPAAPPDVDVALPPTPEPELAAPPVTVIESAAVVARSVPPTKPAAVAIRRARTIGQPAGGGCGSDRAHATWRNRVAPAYPAAARAARQSGHVLVQVDVSASGEATEAHVATSSGVPALDQAALVAARASTYLPRTVAGVPQPDSVTVPYTFRLELR